MKIEIDAKELTAIFDYFKKQREQTCNIMDFSDAILQNMPSKTSAKCTKDECGYSITAPIESSYIKWKL